jgi:hypothetical protein
VQQRRQVALRAPFVNNQVSPAQFDPIALKYLAYIPVSTDPCGRYQYGYPTPSTDNQCSGGWTTRAARSTRCSRAS